jgi:hypothetical protein
MSNAGLPPDFLVLDFLEAVLFPFLLGEYGMMSSPFSD